MKTCQWSVSFAERAELVGYLHSDSRVELALSSRGRLPPHHRSRFALFSHVVRCDASGAPPSVTNRFPTWFQSDLIWSFITWCILITLWADWQDKDHSWTDLLRTGNKNLQVIVLQCESKISEVYILLIYAPRLKITPEKERVSVWTIIVQKSSSMSSVCVHFNFYARTSLWLSLQVANLIWFTYTFSLLGRGSQISS